jgi:hypothetical protein
MSDRYSPIISESPLGQRGAPIIARQICTSASRDLHDSCEHCGCEPSRRKFKRNRCCGKCFYLLDLKRSIAKWDRRNPDTLATLQTLKRQFRASRTALSEMSEEEFAVFKSSYLEQVNDALRHLKFREMRRKGLEVVDAHCLEEKFKSVLELVRLRDTHERVAQQFTGLALLLDRVFNAEQCRVLYGLFDDIEENSYGQITECQKALDAVRHSRPKSTGGDRLSPSAAVPPDCLAARSETLWIVDFRHQITIDRYPLPLSIVVDAVTGEVVQIAILGDRTVGSQISALSAAFCSVGMPQRITVQNGSIRAAVTGLDVWLLEHDIAVSHVDMHLRGPDPSHNEGFRQLRAGALAQSYAVREAAERALARWRVHYNASRAPTHLTSAQANGHKKVRPFSEEVVPFTYEPYDVIRRVQERGRVSVSGKIVRVAKAFRGKDVVLRPGDEGTLDVFFRAFLIARVKMTKLSRAVPDEEFSALRRTWPVESMSHPLVPEDRLRPI